MVYEFERAAAEGLSCPSGLSGFDQMMFFGLSLIYSRLNGHLIDRAEAKVEKAQLERSIAGFKADCRMWEQSAGHWADIEAAVEVYKRDRTRKNADKVCRVLYPQDAAFMED